MKYFLLILLSFYLLLAQQDTLHKLSFNITVFKKLEADKFSLQLSSNIKGNNPQVIQEKYNNLLEQIKQKMKEKEILVVDKDFPFILTRKNSRNRFENEAFNGFAKFTITISKDDYQKVLDLASKLALTIREVSQSFSGENEVLESLEKIALQKAKEKAKKLVKFYGEGFELGDVISLSFDTAQNSRYSKSNTYLSRKNKTDNNFSTKTFTIRLNCSFSLIKKNE